MGLSLFSLLRTRVRTTPLKRRINQRIIVLQRLVRGDCGGQRIVGNGHRPGDGMCVVAPSVPDAGTPSVTRPRCKGREALRDFDENAAPAGAWKLYAKGVQTATPFTTLTLPST